MTDLMIEGSTSVIQRPDAPYDSWIFKESSNSGGPPDFVGRLRQRRPKASLNNNNNNNNNNNSFPNPPKPKEKPAGLKRRLHRRCERETETPRPWSTVTASAVSSGRRGVAGCAF